MSKKALISICLTAGLLFASSPVVFAHHSTSGTTSHHNTAIHQVYNCPNNNAACIKNGACLKDGTCKKAKTKANISRHGNHHNKSHCRNR